MSFNQPLLWGLTLGPLLLSIVLRLYWQHFPAPGLAGLGAFSSILGISLPLIALLFSLKSRGSDSVPFRLPSIVLISALSGLSVVICSNLLVSFAGQQQGLSKVLVLSNTSNQPITKLELWLGAVPIPAPSLAPREKRELTLSIPGEIQLKARLHGSDANERTVQVSIGPENQRIHILIDWNQNLLADVE